tara:strand:- start:1 stop:816 length:816 start_codon:yes stop_codon:yes gene_type:complete
MKKQEDKHKQHTIVYKTKDYAWFKKTKGNRAATAAHRRKIRNSIVEKDLKLPIYVIADGTIREGHNTFEVRKELGLDIYYIISPDFEALDVARFNSGRENWSFQNTLEFFTARQKKSYRIVAGKMSRYNIPIQETVGLLKNELSVSRYTAEDFKWGRYELSLKEIKAFDDLLKPMRECWDIRYPGDKMQRPFIRTISKAVKNPKFSWARLRTIMKSSGAKLDGCTTETEYVNTISNMFDKGLGKSKKLNLKRFVEDKLYLEETNKPETVLH